MITKEEFDIIAEKYNKHINEENMKQLIYKVTYDEPYGSGCDLAHFTTFETAVKFAEEQIKLEFENQYMTEDSHDKESHLGEKAACFIVREKSKKNDYVFSINVYAVKVYDNILEVL